MNRTVLFDGSLLPTPRDALDFIASLLASSTEYSIVGLDKAGQIVLWNEGARRIYGYEPEEVIGKHNGAILHSPEDRAAEKPRQILETALETGRWAGVLTRVRKDGQRFDARAVVTPIRDVTGGHTGFLLISSDLTGKKAEAQFRAMIESAPDAMVIVDRAGKIALVNSQTERMFGYGRAEMLGQPVEMLVPERFAASHVAHRARYSKELRVRSMGEGQELHGRRKDGQEFPVEISLSPLATEDGLLVSSSIRDITERRRLERAMQEKSLELERAVMAKRQAEELRRSDQLFRQLAENIPEVFWVIEPDPPRITYVSPAYEAIWGRPSSGLYDDPSAWAQSVVPEDRPRVEAAFGRMLQGEVTDEEYRIERPDGGIRWIWAKSFPVLAEDGRIECFTGIALDTTERKALDQQLRQSQKMEAVGQLAGGVAHDFNNLLGVISGYSELLLKDLAEDDSRRARAAQILKAADRAAGVTRQLLAFSRRQILQPAVLELNAVVTEIDTMIRRLIGERIQVVTVLATDLGRVRADPGQLEQVILNLAVNARDAMPRGGKLIVKTNNVDLDETYTRTRSDAKPGPHVMLAVSDTGMGIEPEILPKIFEPFFTTKELGKGTGLGLATVYGIVKQSGGHVGVYSELGRGSTFKVYLPRVDAPPTRLRDRHASMTAEAHGTETILLVEDEEGLRQMTREVLEEHGYEVLEADGVDSAIETAKSFQRSIDVLLTDIVMPRMDGPQLAARISALRPGIKVVLMSGYTDEAIEQHELMRSAHFLQKPFTMTSLLEAVRDALRA